MKKSVELYLGLLSGFSVIICINIFIHIEVFKNLLTLFTVLDLILLIYGVGSVIIIASIAGKVLNECICILYEYLVNRPKSMNLEDKILYLEENNYLCKNSKWICLNLASISNLKQ